MQLNQSFLILNTKRFIYLTQTKLEVCGGMRGLHFFALGFLHDTINPCEQQQKKKQGGFVTYIEDQEDEVINP